jgi:hypothetical protein
MIKMSQWKKERKIVKVEVFIRTKDNPVGLNTLLWSLVSQTVLPERITILNTGEEIYQEEIYRVLNLFKEVKIINRLNEYYFDEDGVFNHSFQIIDAIKNFDFDLVWFFDSDLFVPSNCLEELLKKIPSIPNYVVEYEPFNFEEINDVVHYGLLATKKDWEKVISVLKEKGYPKIGEDCIVNKVIKPVVNKKTFIFHTKRHNELHKLVYPELHKQLWKNL